MLRALRFGTFCLLALAAVSTASVAEESDGPRDVISIGGSITEIAFALGQGHKLVARDTTSTFPAEANRLPNVGYMRRLSAEGVLSFAPSLIVSAEGAGPPEVIEILRTASIPLIEIPDRYDREGVVAKIRAVGKALNVPERAEELAQQVDQQLASAELRVAGLTGQRKRVLFILSTQGGRVMAAGTDTAANGIIQMAGGINAVTAFEGYKPLTDEAVSAAQPDVILMMDRQGDHATSDAELFALPALSATPAAEDQSIVRLNGLLMLGFGPRTAQAVTDLNSALYPE